MPRLTTSLPKYRKHKASGQAMVTLDGKDHYLGPHGTQASKREYDRLVGQWQTNGRRLTTDNAVAMTVTEVCAAYWRHAKSYYVKNGRPTDELAGIKVALRHVKDLYGNTKAREFGPLALETVRQRMIDAGNSRGYINDNVARVRRMFKWAAARELIPTSVHQSLMSVDGLRKSKSAARETEPVRPVPKEVVEATLKHCKPVIADMIRFQLLTGSRPGELFTMKPQDVDRSGDVWAYRPASHKMEHKERDRVILIGPKAQAILAPYLLRDAEEFCFLTKRGKPFQRWNYSGPIETACKNAGVERWAPNRLRHTAATEIRRQFGLESAQVILGHAQANTTEIYAEKNVAQAAAIMREVG